MGVKEEFLQLKEDFDEVYEAGKQAEQDAFWDMFQNGGKRNAYGSAFARWGAEYIRPKYKIIPTDSNSASATFENCVNLKKVEAQYFDFSQKADAASNNAGCYYTFNGCNNLEEIEDIGLLPQRNYYSAFANCYKLKTIAKMGVSENTIFNANTFKSCNLLENLTIDGTIGQNNFNLKDSTKLSKASITSVINALSSTTSGLTVTFSKTAVENAGFTDFDCLVNAEFGADVEEDGLTITNNGDGSFTLNGTYTQPSGLFFEVAKFTLPQGTKVYTLDIGSESSNVLMIRTYGGLVIDGECSKAEYETSNEEIHLELVIPYNVAFDNVRVTPKLVYDEWETLELSKKYWTISLV